MVSKKTVVIGFLGTDRDNKGNLPERWNDYRPTVGLFQQDSVPAHRRFRIDRLELLVDSQAGSAELADLTEADILTISPQTELRRHTIDLPRPWSFPEVYGTLFDFAVAYPFDQDTENYYVHVNIYTHVVQICWFLLTEARLVPAKLLQSIPPVGGELPCTVIDLELKQYDQITKRFEARQRDGLSDLKGGIDTRNPRYNTMIKQIELAATTTADPILLLGPTGSGKTELADRIFRLKESHNLLKSGNFVVVNCAAIPENLLESTMFGHKRGAFSGAVSEQKGLAAEAHGGLLFLDEIGELPAWMQAKLLRVIEKKKYRPVGSTTEMSSDFQLVCGTNRDLMADVRRGGFREDLLARICFWSFELPALKDRPQDIEPNLDAELLRASSEKNRKITMTEDARKQFVEFATSAAAQWRGNFRDFVQAVSRMAALAPGGRITTQIVRQELVHLCSQWKRLSADSFADLEDELSGAINGEKFDLFDQLQIRQVLQVCRNSLTLADAGRKLFGVSRLRKGTKNDSDRLRKYLAQFGINGTDFLEAHRNVRQ